MAIKIIRTSVNQAASTESNIPATVLRWCSPRFGVVSYGGLLRPLKCRFVSGGEPPAPAAAGSIAGLCVRGLLVVGADIEGRCFDSLFCSLAPKFSRCFLRFADSLVCPNLSVSLDYSHQY